MGNGALAIGPKRPRPSSILEREGARKINNGQPSLDTWLIGHAAPRRGEHEPKLAAVSCRTIQKKCPRDPECVPLPGGLQSTGYQELRVGY
jgi:hypothetical protein